MHKLNEYLVAPLKNCLEDEEPYVRKTAALCVPKVFEVSPQLIEEAGIIQMMISILNTESNGLVLASLLVSLQEISFIKSANEKEDGEEGKRLSLLLFVWLTFLRQRRADSVD